MNSEAVLRHIQTCAASLLNEDLNAAHLPPFWLEDREDYAYIKQLGKGGVGEVHLVHYKKDGEERLCATKLIPLYGYRVGNPVPELEALQKMQGCPFVARYYDHYFVYNDQYLCIVMELCAGGDVHSIIKHFNGLPEDWVKDRAVELFAALWHMGRLVHRDINVKNTVLTHNGQLKVCDFGLVEELDYTGAKIDFPKLRMCTPLTSSHAVRTNLPHGKDADMWSFGIWLYMACTGRPPYNASNIAACLYYPTIAREHYVPLGSSDSSNSKKVSKGLGQLVDGLLSFNPNLRLSTLELVASDPYIQEAVKAYMEACTLSEEEMWGSKGPPQMLTAQSVRTQLNFDNDTADPDALAPQQGAQAASWQEEGLGGQDDDEEASRQRPVHLAGAASGSPPAPFSSLDAPLKGGAPFFCQLPEAGVAMPYQWVLADQHEKPVQPDAGGDRLTGPCPGELSPTGAASARSPSQAFACGFAEHGSPSAAATSPVEGAPNAGGQAAAGVGAAGSPALHGLPLHASGAPAGAPAAHATSMSVHTEGTQGFGLGSSRAGAAEGRNTQRMLFASLGSRLEHAHNAGAPAREEQLLEEQPEPVAPSDSGSAMPLPLPDGPVPPAGGAASSAASQGHGQLLGALPGLPREVCLPVGAASSAASQGHGQLLGALPGLPSGVCLPVGAAAAASPRPAKAGATGAQPPSSPFLRLMSKPGHLTSERATMAAREPSMPLLAAASYQDTEGPFLLHPCGAWLHASTAPAAAAATAPGRAPGCSTLLQDPGVATSSLEGPGCSAATTAQDVGEGLNGQPAQRHGAGITATSQELCTRQLATTTVGSSSGSAPPAPPSLLQPPIGGTDSPKRGGPLCPVQGQPRCLGLPHSVDAADVAQPVAEDDHADQAAEPCADGFQGPQEAASRLVLHAELDSRGAAGAQAGLQAPAGSADPDGQPPSAMALSHDTAVPAKSPRETARVALLPAAAVRSNQTSAPGCSSDHCSLPVAVAGQATDTTSAQEPPAALGLNATVCVGQSQQRGTHGHVQMAVARRVPSKEQVQSALCARVQAMVQTLHKNSVQAPAAAAGQAVGTADAPGQQLAAAEQHANQLTRLSGKGAVKDVMSRVACLNTLPPRLANKKAMQRALNRVAERVLLLRSLIDISSHGLVPHLAGASWDPEDIPAPWDGAGMPMVLLVVCRALLVAIAPQPCGVAELALGAKLVMEVPGLSEDAWVRLHELLEHATVPRGAFEQFHCDVRLRTPKAMPQLLHDINRAQRSAALDAAAVLWADTAGNGVHQPLAEVLAQSGIMDMPGLLRTVLLQQGNK